MLNVHGVYETNAFDSANGQGGRFTAKGFLIGDAHTAGKTSSDDRNAILWNERGLDIDVATNDTIRMKVHSGGGLIVGAVMTKDTGTFYDDITINNSNTASGAAGGAGLSLVTGASSFGGVIFSTNSSHGRGYMKYDQSNDRLVFGTQTNDVARFYNAANNGDLHLVTGNLVMDGAGKGIDFSAQTVTSVSGTTTTAELLDHYEEGTWTPGARYGGMTVFSANYIRIGSMVTAQCYVSFPTGVTGGNEQGITGFPYDTAAGNRYHSCAVNSDASLGVNLVGQLNNGTNGGEPTAFLVFAKDTNAKANQNEISGHFVLLSITYVII